MSTDVAVLGVGMHPWGKWGRPFTEYGVVAARAALADAGIDWQAVDLVVGGETVRNGYGGYVAGATFAQALGWNGARVATSYAACATGAQALDTARARILAGLSEVALVVGADTTPKGFLAPNAGERWDDPDWLRFRLLGMTNPAYFALYARRRMDLYGATPEDFAGVKVKNAQARAGEPQRPLPQGGQRRGRAGQRGGLRPAAPARHLRDLRRCGGGGRGEHGVREEDRARPAGAGQRGLDGDADVPQHDHGHAQPLDRRQGGLGDGEPERTFKESIAHAAYEEAGISPEDVSLAEVYDLSTALELDWMEDLALCKRGEAESLLRAGDTTIGGRIPVNPSGGLACFGEAVPGPGAGPGLRGDLAAARPGEPAARSRAPRSASPPTRGCSATARRCLL